MPISSNKQVTAAEIVVRMRADIAELKSAMGTATSEIRKFNSETKSQMTEAKHALGLLGDEIGVRIPRELRGVIAQLPGMTSAINAAFSAIAVVGLITIVVEAGKKITEFAEKNEEAARKNKEAWTNIVGGLQSYDDSLRLANDKLENSIAKLEHKPQNKMKEAIDEAIVSADTLGKKLSEDIGKIAEALKTQQVGLLSRITGNAGSSDITEHAQDLQNKLLDINAEESSRLRSMREQKATQDQLNDATKHFNDLRREAIKDQQDWVAAQLKAAQAKLPMYGAVDGALGSFGLPSPLQPTNQDRLRLLNQLKPSLGIISDTITDSQTNSGLQGRKANDEAGAEAQRKRGQAILEMVKLNAEAAQQNQRILAEVTQSFVEGQKQEEEASKKAAEQEKKDAADYFKDQGEKLRQQQIFAKQQDEQITNAAEMRTLQAESALKSGQTDAHGFALAKQAIDAQQYADKLTVIRQQIAAIDAMTSLSDSATNQRASLVGSMTQLQDQQQMAAMQDSLAVMATSWRGMVDSVFDEIIAKSQQTTEEVKATTQQFISGVNDQIVKAMTGQHFDFAGVFRSAASGLAKTGLQKVEGIGMQALGLGKRDGSSASAAIWVQSVHAGGSDSAIPPSIASLFASKTPNVTGPGGMGLASTASKGLLGILNNSNWASSLFGGSLFGAGSLFGGGRALGGDVMGGVSYNIGELGPETVTFPANGKVTPSNSQPRGNGPLIGYLDARGTDPALTQANVARAMAMTHARAVADAGRATSERMRRTAR